MKGSIKPIQSKRAERTYSVCLAESAWNFVVTILEKETKYQKHLIAKTRQFPSETIRSADTRELKQEIVDDIKSVLDAICAEAF